MTIRTSRLLKALLIPSLLAAWLWVANPAAAASITDWTTPDPSPFDDGTENVPPPEFSGWFVTFDPSNEWTSAANIATLESWLATAEQITDDPFTGDTPPLTSALSPATALVPEPATLGLLGIALAILLIYVPIRRSHRSLRN
jgi:hypothetical protein